MSGNCSLLPAYLNPIFEGVHLVEWAGQPSTGHHQPTTNVAFLESFASVLINIAPTISIIFLFVNITASGFTELFSLGPIHSEITGRPLRRNCLLGVHCASWCRDGCTRACNYSLSPRAHFLWNLFQRVETYHVIHLRYQIGSERNVGK